MDIECQGCYYTLCSFVCLTEDLSEILQFLWRHGCLRKAYSCEKCGRKCAIGDKDLFFRCNRNLVDDNSEQMTTSSMTPVHDNMLDHNNIESSNGVLHLDLQSMPHHYMLNHSLNPHRPPSPGMQIHPALRHSAPLPGDPLPPSHASPVIPHLDRHFMICPDSLVGLHYGVNSDRDDKVLTVMDRNPNLIQSVQVDDIGSLPDSELADLDAQAKNSKRSRNGSSGTSSVLGAKKRCNFKVSMKKGTFFEKSKLPIDTVCKFVVFWCCMKHPTQEFLRNELSLATRTVVDWSTTCREICIHWAKTNSEKIGGDGVMVQVDEVKVVIGKGGDTGNRFSFWGIEKDKEKGRIFIVPVAVCDAWTLLTVVNEWILPGSVIISNCWKTYDCLKLQDYVQQTVIHSKTFVHPPNNAGQNNFDGKADDVSGSGGIEMHMPRFGTRRSHHLGDLAEFMFKRRYSNHLERMHSFFRQVALAYPLR